MRQKSGPESSGRKTRSGTFGARRVDTFQLKRRSASYWKGPRGGEHSRSCAAARASPHRCTMAGRRSSLRPVKGGSPATRRAPRRLKNRILLEHYYLPGDLERQVAAFVAHYNHARYHEEPRQSYPG